MNRAERRRNKMKNSEAVINVKAKDIQAYEERAQDNAVDIAFKLMLAIPVMVIHDKYAQLMKREGREERFVDLCLDLYDSYTSGYVTLEELTECLWDEGHIRLERS